MSDGLKTTFALLTKTNNEAAVDALLPALDSHHQAVEEEALRALLMRRGGRGHREILHRWPRLEERSRAILAERPARMAIVLREAIVGRDEEMCLLACEAITTLREYDHVAVLITASEDENNPRAELAARTVLQLAELLCEDLTQQGSARGRRNPALVRSHVLASLDESVRRFPNHKRREILEAFLLLVGHENATLSGLLRDPHNHTYLPLVDLLSRSQRSGVLRLLLSFLDEYDAPLAALNVVAKREDIEFLQLLLKRIGFEPSGLVRVSLKRIERLAWLREGQVPLDQLNDAQQHSLVQLITHSGMKRLEVFAALEDIIQRGNSGGRRAAMSALSEFRGAAAAELCLAALEDPDARVQAIAISQLRTRGLKCAMQKLLGAITSPHELVRKAARESLEELSAARFIASFDMLEESSRASIARLVRHIDPQAPALLAAELRANSRGRKLRGLEAAQEMGLTQHVQAALIDLLEDDDHIIRVKAVAALATCRTPAAAGALRRALGDRNAAVQRAAEASLLAGAKNAPTPTPSSEAVTVDALKWAETRMGELGNIPPRHPGGLS